MQPFESKFDVEKQTIVPFADMHDGTNCDVGHVSFVWYTMEAVNIDALHI